MNKTLFTNAAVVGFSLVVYLNEPEKYPKYC